MSGEWQAAFWIAYATFALMLLFIAVFVVAVYARQEKKDRLVKISFWNFHYTEEIKVTLAAKQRILTITQPGEYRQVWYEEDITQ